MENLIPFTICKQPKTIILISGKLRKREKEAKKKRYLDEAGKLRIDTVGEYDTIHSKYK